MLRVQTIGDFRVEVAGSDRTAPAVDRAMSLLAWLALNPGLHPRATVAARFWPDIVDESARASLRSALWSLRRRLGGDANGALLASRERVGLADDVWVDVAEAERLGEAGRLDEALALADGELLPGFEDEWVLEARDEHRLRLAALLERAARAAEEAGDLRRAAEQTRRAAALDPLSEDAHRDLMRRLAAAGDRGAALVVFHDLRTRLLQTLRVGPSDETRQLAESLRADPSAPAVPASLRRVDQALFVGRAAELARLRRLWSTARETVAVGLVSGEAGSGKTRLAARFAVESAAAGGTVLYGTCQEQPLVPYEPLAEAVGARGELGLGPEELETRLERLPGERVLLVVDDLQWADRATLALLLRLVRGPLAERLTVVAAFREDEAEAHLYRAVADLRRDCEIERVELPGLGLEEVAALIGAAFETSAATTQARAIHDRTGGNPFFVRELARHVAERPRDVFADVPEGIRDIVRARVARLSPGCVDALASASVLGESFEVTALALAAGTDEAVLLGLLDEAVAAGLLEEAGVGRYGFSHALTRDAVYAGLGAGRRATLHRAAAAALAERHGLQPGRKLAEIALHRCAAAADGTDVDEAVALAEQAAEAALEGAAYEQAVAILTRALGVLPDSDLERRRRLMRQRGVAYARLWHVLADV